MTDVTTVWCFRRKPPRDKNKPAIKPNQLQKAGYGRISVTLEKQFCEREDPTYICTSFLPPSNSPSNAREGGGTEEKPRGIVMAVSLAAETAALVSIAMLGNYVSVRTDGRGKGEGKERGKSPGVL